jgi:hypothetical protein
MPSRRAPSESIMVATGNSSNTIITIGTGLAASPNSGRLSKLAKAISLEGAPARNQAPKASSAQEA